MIGAGKYDAECTAARIAAGAEGAIVIMINGRHGNGFSAQLPEYVIKALPHLLRHIASEIEKDGVKVGAFEGAGL